ncbi:sec-independent protein translocase protein TatA [Terracoccus luteus]|uniref:Sec-independent protein translocase protein TatA n=1 Tax=Terracoccus luteus TaxID=53356 RepID=A0A495XZ76_9MICO|nr:Sec-independent protein translocase subunit TatA [Terracoccus luteus]RKT78026.1 sec-independent protein translocase protein TatA [Terracoccus luteus]
MNLGWPELTILAVIIIALFGWKKLPDMARSLGRSARVFKSEVDEMKKDGKENAAPSTVHGDLVDDRPRASAYTDASSPRTDVREGSFNRDDDSARRAAEARVAEAEARAAEARAEAARLRGDSTV